MHYLSRVQHTRVSQKQHFHGIGKFDCSHTHYQLGKAMFFTSCHGTTYRIIVHSQAKGANAAQILLTYFEG